MSSPEALPRVDGGLQPERTTLAFLRTAIVMIAVNLLLARVAMDREVMVTFAALVSLAVPVGLLVGARRAYSRGVARLVGQPGATSFGHHVVLSIYVLWTSALSVAIVL